MKWNFRKYPSIENSYNTKYIMRWLEEFPELENHQFVLTEKIDGANFALYVQGGEWKIAKRSDFITPDEKFYRIWEFLNSSGLKEKFTLFAQNWNQAFPNELIILYGEYFGEGIQKRINYGEKKIRFFEYFFNDTFPYAPQLNNYWINNSEFVNKYWIIDPIEIFPNLNKALDFDVNISSKEFFLEQRK